MSVSLDADREALRVVARAALEAAACEGVSQGVAVHLEAIAEALLGSARKVDPE